MTTRLAVDVLVEAAETALDSNDLSLQYSSIAPYFHVPVWLQRLYSTKLFPKLARNLLYRKLSFGVELATAFLLSSEKCVFPSANFL